MPAIWEAMADVAALSSTGWLVLPLHTCWSPLLLDACLCCCCPILPQTSAVTFFTSMQAPRTMQSIRSMHTVWGPAPVACWALQSLPYAR